MAVLSSNMAKSIAALDGDCPALIAVWSWGKGQRKGRIVFAHQASL